MCHRFFFDINKDIVETIVDDMMYIIKDKLIAIMKMQKKNHVFSNEVE